jgi:two-component system phosphate regulon sensor histidine kinase PhoR
MDLRWAVKIFGAFILIVALLVIPADLYLTSRLNTLLLNRLEEGLKRDLQIAALITAETLSKHRSPSLMIQEAVLQVGRLLGERVTLLSPDGHILGDSHITPALLTKSEDMSHRPEILAVKTRGYGQAIRFSPDIQANALFGALPVRKDGTLVGYVRLALSLEQNERALTSQKEGLYLIAGMIVLSALLISLFLSGRIVRPLRELTDMVQAMDQGNYKQPFHLLTSRETQGLSLALESLANGLKEKMELLESETGELKTLLTAMREGVLVTDEKGRIILINPFLNEVLGGKDSWKKRSVQEAFMSAELQDAVEAVLKGDPFQKLHLSFGREAPRNFEVQVVALSSPRRQPRAVALFHETTELSYLLKVRQTFVANASWELDKPLTAMNQRLETLMPRVPENLTEVRQELISIHKEIKRLCLLVSDMLDLAKLDVLDQGGRVFERVAVQEVLKSAKEMIDKQASGKNLKIEMKVDHLPDPLFAQWEKDRIQQALFNVLDNAVKYTGEGGEIRLTAELVSDFGSGFSESEKELKTDQDQREGTRNPQSVIRISIADTGIGIPKDHLPRIFERFYRVDRDYSRQLGGTGLGLSIVKHIVEAHGGTVNVQTSVGKGTIFILRIPLEPKKLSPVLNKLSPLSCQL